MSPILGESPGGLGTGSTACRVSHLAGICLGARSCLASLAQLQGPLCLDMSLGHGAHPRAAQLPGMDAVLCLRLPQSNGQQ